VFYFLSNHVWNGNKIISGAEGVLKLFENYFSNMNILETRQPALFSQHRRPTPHFWGAHTGRLWPHIRSRLRSLCNVPTSKLHHPMFTRSEVIVSTNRHTKKQRHKQTKTQTNKQQTNRRRWKHPTLSALLRRWTNIQ